MTREDDSDRQHAVKVLLCGGLAGVVTWASIFPLGTYVFQLRYVLCIANRLEDVVKTRMQTWDFLPSYQSTTSEDLISRKPTTLQVARDAYRAEGFNVFFRGLGICSARAFIVNAVQWAVSTR